jgi:hypothetical protein
MPGTMRTGRAPGPGRSSVTWSRCSAARSSCSPRSLPTATWWSSGSARGRRTCCAIPTWPARSSRLPFGAGATKCIGEEFGLAEATLIVASIAARWDLTRDKSARVDLKARAVLVPAAFPVRLSARRPSQTTLAQW